MTLTRGLALTLLCFVLSACGWHLKNYQPLDKTLSPMTVDAPEPYSSLTKTLRNQLRMAGINITHSQEYARSHLVILSDKLDERLVTVSSTTRVRQYALSYLVHYRLENHKREPIVAEQVARIDRTLTMNQNQMLAADDERRLVREHMRQDIVRQIIRQLAKVSSTHYHEIKP